MKCLNACSKVRADAAFALALFLCAGMATGVHAQAGAECRPGGTLEEANACALRDFQAVDTLIAMLYQDVMRALAAHERPQLRREHSAWISQRTSQCKQATRAVEQQPDGPRRYHECLSRATLERRAGLMRWLSMDSPARE